MDAKSAAAFGGLRTLADRLSPWLFDVGSWIFGGLIAFNLIVISALITVGPADRAILTSITAFTAALPLNVAGIVLLRLVKDAADIGIDEVTLKAFQDAGFPAIDAYFPPPEEAAARRKRRAHLALAYSLGIATLSSILTLVGLVAALWHMAWWVAVVLLAAAALSAFLVLAVGVHSMPPESEAERDLKRQYREHRARRKSRPDAD
jgi:hypothetical protein